MVVLQLLSLRLALRGLGRRRGRTALTVGMLAASTWMLVFASGLNEGSYAEMIRMATSTFVGQAQLQHPDYEATPSLYETVADGAAAAAALRQHPAVAGAAPRIEAGALLSKGNRTAGALLVGVDPAAERATSTLAGMVARGTLLDPPAGAPAPAAADGPVRLPVALGEGLARRLRAELGDELVLLTQAADGSMAAELLVLVGVLASGVAELDGTIALLRLQDAATLLELGGRVHRVAVRLHDVGAAQRFTAGFAAPAGTRLLHWRELLPSLEACSSSSP
jgi:ABC-type lipoprotein release transport system permease subunit